MIVLLYSRVFLCVYSTLCYLLYKKRYMHKKNIDLIWFDFFGLIWFGLICRACPTFNKETRISVSLYDKRRCENVKDMLWTTMWYRCHTRTKTVWFIELLSSQRLSFWIKIWLFKLTCYLDPKQNVSSCFHSPSPALQILLAKHLLKTK